MFKVSDYESDEDCYNFDLDSVVTPLNVELFGKLLKETNYCERETEFLIEGFTNGFDIGYRGVHERQSYVENIPITVGSTQELRAKIMKEVREKRYAGPYTGIPFKNFIQSPIGLVPKAGKQNKIDFSSIIRVC